MSDVICCLYQFVDCCAPLSGAKEIMGPKRPRVSLMSRKTFCGWGFAPYPKWELTSPPHSILFNAGIEKVERKGGGRGYKGKEKGKGRRANGGDVEGREGDSLPVEESGSTSELVSASFRSSLLRLSVLAHKPSYGSEKH